MTLALDKRVIDQDGRLHVAGCRISKANVCPYFGREIPNWQELGLTADRVYHMYRDPKSLAEAAATFENVPLMLDHIVVSADAPAHELIAGTVSNARYEHPYLVADVTAWTQEAIDGIESGDRKELSCAYRYVASMIAGTSPDGVRYDGKMVGPMKANHVALVEKGRAGPDVVIADGVPRTMKRPKIFAALSAILATVAQPAQLAALDEAMDAELPGADAFPDLDDNDKKAARDAAMQELGCDALSPEQERDAYQRAARDKKAAKDAVPHAATGGGDPKAATDAAIQLAVDAAVNTARDGYVLAVDAATRNAEAIKLAEDSARAEVHALYAAREAVAAKVGVVTCDTAEGVYRFALDHLKVEHKDVAAPALADLYTASVKAPGIASDAAPVKAFNVRDLFPNTSNIRRA